MNFEGSTIRRTMTNRKRGMNRMLDVVRGVT